MALVSSHALLLALFGQYGSSTLGGVTQAQWKSTACILCECNCGIEVQLGGEDGRRLTKIRGDRRHPSSQGYTCEKALRLDYYQNGRDRLTQPLRRRPDGSFEVSGGALRVSPVDAAELGVVSGDRVRLTTKRGQLLVDVEVSDIMRRGHLSLPNGLGLSYPDSGSSPSPTGAGGEALTGAAPNELTSVEDRDPFVGTPWHKHVPARIERVAS